jgi:hypothetical protein
MSGISYPEGFFDFGGGLSTDDLEIQGMIDDCLEYLQRQWERKGFKDGSTYVRSGRTFVGIFAHLDDECDLVEGIPPKFTLRVFVMSGGETLTLSNYVPPVPPKWERI